MQYSFYRSQHAIGFDYSQHATEFDCTSAEDASMADNLMKTFGGIYFIHKISVVTFDSL